MQETAHTFCPSRCAASVLCLLWCACSFGVLSIYGLDLSLIHLPQPTRTRLISDAGFCLKKKKKT